MKSLIWILYSFLVLIIFSDIQAQNNQETIIKGKIINSGTENIYFKYNNIIDTVNLNNNKFELKININSPQYLYCFLGMAQYFPVYIFPGDVITVDFEKLTKDYKLTFGGNTNSYLNYFNELDNSLTSIYNDTSFYQKDSLFLFARIDSIYNIKIERFNKLKSLNPDLDKNFYNYEPIRLYCEKASLSIALSSFRFFSPLEEYNYSDSPFKSIPVVTNLNDSNLMQLEEFKSLLFVHYLWKMLSIMYTYKDKVDPYSIPLDSLMFQVFGNVDSDFTNVQITDYVKYYFLSLYIPYSKAGSLDKSVSYFRETCKNKEYLDYVNSLKPLETLNKYEGKDSVEKSDLTGKKAPDFTCDDLKGNKYSLNDFKGKYVFIDFWATWCGPCKQEIPHMKKLVKDYKFYDEIIFVSISLDGDQIKWKEFVKDNNMTWLQLWAKPDSKYFEEYQVEYIPKFVIIDKERKILNANAPRPSDKELKEVLDKILEN